MIILPLSFLAGNCFLWGDTGGAFPAPRASPKNLNCCRRRSMLLGGTEAGFGGRRNRSEI